MAGSDINVVSKNKAALSNTSSNVATTVTLFAGPMRLKGFIVEPSTVAGVLTWKDGGTFYAVVGQISAGSISWGAPISFTKTGPNCYLYIGNL